MSETPLPYRSLTANTQGRDWFVGDIHGCFEQLGAALLVSGFHEDRDRLISVGDLIDRGTESERATEWLKLPFFHAIRGNHEDMYLEWRSHRGNVSARKKFESETYFKPVNGGRWVSGMTEAEHVELERELRKLPYFLAVPHLDGTTIGVVHAELPEGVSWPGLINRPLDAEMRRAMTWGRHRWRAWRGLTESMSDGNTIAGLDAVVCGHVRTREAMATGNIVYLDTGGWSERGIFSVLSFEDILDLVAEAKDPDALMVGHGSGIGLSRRDGEAPIDRGQENIEQGPREQGQPEQGDGGQGDGEAEHPSPDGSGADSEDWTTPTLGSLHPTLIG